MFGWWPSRRLCGGGGRFFVGSSLVLALAGAAATGPASIAVASPARSTASVLQPVSGHRTGCKKRSAQGWAPTEHFARLKAWEQVAQASDNWPIQTDEFRSARYQCRSDRGGRLCRIAVDVCRRG